MAAALGAGEDLEARRGQFLRQPSLAELLRAVAIDGGAEERVGDPTKGRRRTAIAVASEQIASLGDEGVQLGALALQGCTGRSRIAELQPKHVLHAVNEPREPLGVLVRELIGDPERRARPPQLTDRVGLRRLAGLPERPGLGVSLAREGTRRNAVELLDGAG
jgi:hypothetical protein